jgi:mono/diheme cytochrome c family protein
MNRKMQRILAGVMMLLAIQAFGQEWTVPVDQAALPNPSDYTLDNVKSGKALYTRNCKSCHGDPGKNNPLTLAPMPVDIASDQMQSNTEGAIFHKITVGRGVMPPFETTISEDDRWTLVNFIMNFNPEREQLLVDAPPIKARLLTSVNESSRTVEVLAEFEKEDGSFANLVNVPVIISSRKAFGNIEMGKAITAENGRADFVIPEDVIGDEEGFVSIVVSLDENYIAEEVALEKAVVGRSKEVPKLISGEVLWSTNDNLQLWMLLSYIFAVGFAWSVIVYVIVQVVKIKKYGKSESPNIK